MKNEPRLTPFMRIAALAIALVVPLGTAPVNLNAATFFWDPTLASGPVGGAGTWDTSTANWFDGSGDVVWPNTAADIAVFATSPFAAPPVAYAVAVSSGIVAHQLSFASSGYTLSGGDITLSGAGAGIRATVGESAQIDSQINGVDGLTLTGGGSVRLTNILNGYTGTTTLSNGTLLISDQAVLGADSSAIVVTGFNPAAGSTNVRGFAAGSLYLDGMVTGFTVSRDLSLQGFGPISASGAALVSAGNNTVSGTVTMGEPFMGTNLSTRIISAAGNLNITGTLNILGVAGTTVDTLGGVSTAGLGSYNLTGVLAGTGTLEKAGGGTLFLNPSDSSGFSGVVRVSAAGVGQSEVRITSPDVLGTRVNTGTASVLDLNGGILSVFMDSPSVNTSGDAAPVYLRNGSSIYVNHTPGSSVQNQTVTFGRLTFEENETMTFTGANGYNVSFGVAAVNGGNNNSTFTNNLAGGGELTFTGAFWNNTDNGAARTVTMNGTGNTILTGNLTASATSFDHNLTKAGTGTLTIRSVAGTLDGAVNTSGGLLAITDFRSINLASTSTINIGANQTAGILNFGTSTASTAAGLTSAVQGVTVAQFAYAAGASTVTLRSVTGVTTGATITGTGIAPGTTITAISGNVVTLSANATAAGAVNTALTVAGVQNTRVINLAGTTGGATINANQTAGSPVILAAGTLSTTVVSASGNGAKTLTLGGTSTQLNAINGAIVNGTAATSVTKAGAGTWVLGGVNTYTGATTVTQGILRLNANAGASTILADGSAISFNVEAATQAAGGTLQFVGFSGAPTIETLGPLTPAAGAGTIILTGSGGASASLNFTSLGAVAGFKGGGLNFVTTGAVGGAVTLTGVATTGAATLPGNGHLYFNGADFAVSTLGVLGAPTYAAAGAIYTTAPLALTAAKHNLVTGSYNQAAVQVTSLKITTDTLTLTGNLSVNTGAVVNDGGILQTGGTATIGGSGLISTGGAGTLVIRVNAATDVLNLNTNLGSSMTGGFTKNGLGKLVINAVNAQTGATTINEGTVQLAGSGRLSAANVATVLRQGATLDLNGLSTDVAIGAFNGAGIVTNTNAVDGTLLLGGTTTGAGTFSGIIQDGVGITHVTVNGTTGTLVLSGASTYTGVTTIGTGLATAKLLSVPILTNYGSASGIGRGIQTVVDDANNAASLVFNGTTGGINYTGADPVSVDRLFTLNSSLVGGGGQIANASSTNASLVFNKTNALTFGASATGVVQTLTLGGSSTGDNEFNLQIVDNPNGPTATNLNKIGNGIWRLGNTANNYTGTTTISQGFLDALDGTTLSNNSGLILGNVGTTGVLKSSGNFTRNVVVTGSAGVNTVSWNGNLTSGTGGFSANDLKLTVAMGGIGTETPLTWGAGGFATSSTAGTALVFNSATALAEIEWRNPIDLNLLLRTFQVDDNTSVATDFATITGVISGTGVSGVNKTGAGILRLLGNNTYEGVTAVANGQLIVKSLGNSAAPGATSVGDSTAGNTDAGAITLGNGVNTGGVLEYIGAGETSDRKIRLNTTNATNQIHADGIGPLILTNVANDMTAAVRPRPSSSAAPMPPGT